MVANLTTNWKKKSHFLFFYILKILFTISDSRGLWILEKKKIYLFIPHPCIFDGLTMWNYLKSLIDKPHFLLKIFQKKKKKKSCIIQNQRLRPNERWRKKNGWTLLLSNLSKLRFRHKWLFLFFFHFLLLVKGVITMRLFNLFRASFWRSLFPRVSKWRVAREMLIVWTVQTEDVCPRWSYFPIQ